MIVRANQSDLVEELVDEIELELQKRLFETSPKPIGLATGRTMTSVYSSLLTRLKRWPAHQLESLLEGWCSFNLDEYVGLGVEDIPSFIRYMSCYLGDPLQLGPKQLFIPNGIAKDPNHEAFLYLQKLNSCGGIGMQLLGLGANGHIGFNEPPSGSESSCRVVCLSPFTKKQNAFAFGGEVDKVPDYAITLGIQEILQAEKIHLVVTGQTKASILSKLLNSSVSEDLPASWLKLHSNVYIWADQSAIE